MNNILDKYAILKQKICTQYDEDFFYTGIVPNEDDFYEMARKVRAGMRFTYTDAEFINICKEVREIKEATLGITRSVDKPSDDHDLEWFTKYCHNNPDNNKYNQRFKKYLIFDKFWSQETVEDLDRNTDEIVNRLGDPNKKEPWKRKGLVIGDVQSGKTVNYTSVCNKAIDAGYKIIIILAGRTNTLRKQTQKRLEKDFVGMQKDDSNAKKGEVLPTVRVGVSLYGKVGSNQVETFTTNTTDFSKKVADSTTITINEHMLPKLFVVKKVKSVLDNLADWFGKKTVRDVPMLLIDDEADDASINTKAEDSPTAINACIRKILKLFSHSTYLAITATPFANIMIDPYVPGTDDIDKDLFPEDFICCLPTPSNYIGSEIMFRDEEDTGWILPVEKEDVENAFPFKHKKSQQVLELPYSLKTAIRYFAITNAVRDILGQTKSHRSMMVNVSRFVDVQNRLKNKIYNFWFNEIMLYIKAYSKMGEKALDYKPIIEIKNIFDRFEVEKHFGINWETIQNFLFESNAKVKVVSINQKSTDSIDYEKYEKENNDGLKVIAVGGDCLSRGLTLEGLCVSYFYRNSKAYDTLMQMGRWFGFRPGYGKLVKVWMAAPAIEWYSHISESTEELKLEVFRMNRSKLTPMEFGYMIQGHPDSLIPTARMKMKNARVDLKYLEVCVDGLLVESPKLPNSIDKLRSNANIAADFIKKVSKYGKVEGNNNKDIFIRNVKAEDVAALVDTFQAKKWNFYFDSSNLSEAISNHVELWNVIIKNGPKSGKSDWNIEINNTEQPHAVIGAQRRTSTWDQNEIRISGTKLKVGAGGCTFDALEKYTREDVQKKWATMPPEIRLRKDGTGDKDIPDNFLLHGFIERPVLFIHNLFITDENGLPLLGDNSCNIIALGLGFPSDVDYETAKKSDKNGKRVKVYLNVIAQELADEEGDDFVDENR